MTYQNADLREVELGDEILSLAQLKAVDPTQFDKHTLVRLDDGRTFYYHPTSELDGDDIFVITPNGLTGRYILAPGVQRVPLTVTAALADAAVLATLPTGFIGQVIRGDWGTPTTSFTGGTSSTIGLSSSNAAHNTKGDLHGGASGNLAAALADTAFMPGTIGADIAAGAFLVGGNTILYDEITSAFTAGATVAGLTFNVIANPGE